MDHIALTRRQGLAYTLWVLDQLYGRKTGAIRN